MKYLILSVFLLTGCVTNPSQQFKETPECMNYYGMMTAPISPDASERLKQDCIASRK